MSASTAGTTATAPEKTADAVSQTMPSSTIAGETGLTEVGVSGMETNFCGIAAEAITEAKEYEISATEEEDKQDEQEDAENDDEEDDGDDEEGGDEDDMPKLYIFSLLYPTFPC